MKQSVTYQIECGHCKEQGKETKYFGESARSGFQRGLEHYKALQNEDGKSPLVKHWKEEHGSQEWAFQMKIMASHKTPLLRQATEGYNISTFKGNLILNSKGEWRGNLPPRMVVESPDRNEQNKALS